MKRFFVVTLLALIAGRTLVESAQAQDRGDRGDRRDRGSRGDDDSGSGGPRGGFGGGGFGGPPDGFSGGSFGGPPGGDPGSDRSSRFGSMMDSNGNGKIDQEEIDRMPSFVRDMMKARGVELKAGISVDDMRNSFRSSMNGGSNPPPGAPQQANTATAGVKTLTPYKMKPKKPVTLTLPPLYSEIDTDFDGQLGMYEWMMTRRADIEQFDTMDTDQDGYLTPEELTAADAAAASQNALVDTGRKRLLIVNATPAKRKPAAPGQQAGDNGTTTPPGTGPDASRGAWGGGDPNVMATESFRRLDSNGDGFVDTNEWQQSRRTRGMFEQAGIKLDKMSLADFTRHYGNLSTGNGER